MMMKKFKLELINNLFTHCFVCKIFGTAGSGKTSFLLNELNKLFIQGVIPEQIAFMSFTKKAINEVIDRSLKQFSQFQKKQFYNFRTIHSMCYKNNENKNILLQQELFNLAKTFGMKISCNKNIEDGFGTKQGDKVIMIEALSRLRLISLKQQWQECNFFDCPFFMVKQWQDRLNKYKKEHNLIDFTDLLEQYHDKLNVDYIFIDEAQDLSPLQWHVINQASQDIKKIFIAGDDDQAIFNWAGADIEYFLNIKSNQEIILKYSYRLPKTIYKMSRKILKRIKTRKNKKCSNIKKEGKILYVVNFEQINFEKNEHYLILVRNRYQTKKIKKVLEKKGLPFFLFDKNTLKIKEVQAIILWERLRQGKNITNRQFNMMQKYSTFIKNVFKKEDVKKELLNKEWFIVLNLINYQTIIYLRILRQNGYKFYDIPKIKITTIHQSKGGECDNVIVFTDISHTVWENKKNDYEHRVWYVAITRAKQRLFIIREQTNKFYKI
jgi:DNA helicase-2/ATP-dependent DNA helicase PcrA